MKSLFKCLALLGVVLLTASSTVKADEKPNKIEATNTEPVLVAVRTETGYALNYQPAQFMVAAGNAFSNLNITSVGIDLPSDEATWLVVSGVRTDTITPHPVGVKVYISLNRTTSGLEMMPIPWGTNPPGPTGNFYCYGWCTTHMDDTRSCKNVSKTAIVVCDCAPTAELEEGNYCHFSQGYPTSNQTMCSILSQMQPIQQ